jgi:hypothetical protein
VRAEPGDPSRLEHHVASRDVPLLGPSALNREGTSAVRCTLLSSGTRDFLPAAEGGSAEGPLSRSQSFEAANDLGERQV